MTKYIYHSLTLFIAVALFTACAGEEDNIFDKSAAERLNEVSSIYTQRLCDSPGGWVMEYYPYTDNENLNTGVGYLIMNRFHDNGSVYSLMKNKANIYQVVSDSSAFEVITDMGPVLTYNTYNKCLGRFSDPDDDTILTGGKNGSDESGKGLQGDYEFVMVDVPQGGDHIMLKGKKRGIYQRLSRVPEGTDFVEYLDDIAAFGNKLFNPNAPSEYVLTSDGMNFRLDKMHTGRPRFFPEGKDSVAYGSYQPFLITKYNDAYHLRFKDTIRVGNTQLEQEFTWNEAEDKFYGKTNTANVITSAYASMADFFKEKMGGEHKFMLYRNTSRSDMSAKMKKYLDDASNAMNQRNSKYRIDSLKLSTNGSAEVEWSYRYQQGYNAKDQPYKFTSVFEGNTVTFAFVEPTETYAAAVMNSVAEVKKLLTEVLSQKFVIDKYITIFDLTKIKLTSESDPDLWFVINY